MQTRLRDTQLVGARMWIRRGWFIAMLALPVLGALGYVLPAHSTHGGAFHSNYDDGGPWPLVIYGALFAIAWLLQKKKLGAGMLLGLLAPAAAIAALAPVFLVHLFSDVTTASGETLFAIAEIGLFLGGIAMVIAEPILYITQRRSNEREVPVAHAII